MMALPDSLSATISRNQRPQSGVLLAAGLAGAAGVAPPVAGAAGVAPAVAGAGSNTSVLLCGRSRVTGWPKPALVMVGLKAWLITSPVGCAGKTAASGVR